MVSFNEITKYLENKQGIRRLFSSICNQTLTDIINVCQFCFNEVSNALINPMSLIFQEPLLNGFNKLWHQCDDYFAKNKMCNWDLTIQKDCKCSLIALIIKLGLSIPTSLQIKAKVLVTEIAKQIDFKMFCQDEYLKYQTYMFSNKFNNDSDNVEEYISQFTDIDNQIFGNDEMCQRALKNPNCKNIISIMKDALFHSQYACQEVIQVINEQFSIIRFMMDSKFPIAKIILLESNFLAESIDLISSFQMKFFQNSDLTIKTHDHEFSYIIFNKTLIIEINVQDLFQECLKIYHNYEPQQQIKLQQQIFDKLVGELLNIDTITADVEGSDGVKSMSPCLQRSFSKLIFNILPKFNQESLIQLLQQNIADFDADNVGRIMSKSVLQTLGRIRFLHLTHNFQQGNIWEVYYYINNLIFENDIVNCQMACLLMDSKGINEFIVENFFGYTNEVRECLEDPKKFDIEEKQVESFCERDEIG